MIIFMDFIVPYLESKTLCKAIEAGRTEEAIDKINKMKNVNCSTAPDMIRPILNLLEKDTDLPLIAACKAGNVSVVEALLKNGADCNKYLEGGFTAAEAIFCGNYNKEFEILKLLIYYDADVTKTASGISPLFRAARKMIYSDDEKRKTYLAKCVEMLLIYDDNLIDDNGMSILHYAVKADNIALARVILEKEKEETVSSFV